MAQRADGTQNNPPGSDARSPHSLDTFLELLKLYLYSTAPQADVHVAEIAAPEGAKPLLGTYQDEVRRILGTREAWPGLVELSARVSPSTRQDPGRMSWAHVWEDTEVHAAMENAAQKRGTSTSTLDARKVTRVSRGEEAWWAVLCSVGINEGPCFGLLAAVFCSQKAARAARADVRALADELVMTLLLYRHASNQQAMVGLSSIMAEARDHRESVDTMARLLLSQMDSDGAKIYLLRRTPQGPKIQRIFRSDGPDTLAMFPVTGLGLAPWVINHDDWLLVRSAAQPGKPERAISGKHGEVDVMALPGGDDDPTKDEERTLLVAPLRVQGQVLGSLSTWRLDDCPYDKALDISALEQFAAAVASSSRWLVQWETLEAQADVLSDLGQLATSDRPHIHLHQELVVGACKLGRTARGLLLLGNSTRPGVYYSASDCTVDEDGLAQELGQRLLVHCDDPRRWHEGISAAIAQSPDLLENDGRTMRLWDVFPLEPMISGGVEQPSGVVVLLEYEYPDQDTYHTLDDDLCHTAVESLLAQVDPILRNHRGAHAQRTAEQVAVPKNTPQSALEVLLWAADLLKETTNCDAALVYSLRPEGMEVCGTSPRMPRMIGLRPGQESLTNWSITHQEPVQIVEIPDVTDPHHDDVDQAALSEITDALGWEGVASWICYPVTHEGTCVGLIKLLTQEGGRFLGHCQVEVLKAVADRAAQEMRQISERLNLEKLNTLSNDLAAKEGEALAKDMAVRLREWSDTFIRPGCRVAVVSSVTVDEPEIFAVSPGIDEDLQAALRLRSHALDGDEGQWSDQAVHGMAMPVRVAGSEHPRGHLFVLANESFRTVDRLAAQEAAREVAILVDQERRRLEWAQKVALFRHAVLGPVQGLTSAARTLHELLDEAEFKDKDPELVATLRGLVEKEAEALRLWRVNQRLYTRGRHEVERRNTPLRPVVKRCAQRFEEVLATRGITFFLDWRVKGSVDFPFDPDALDLVLCNVLDNSRKYSFYNREVVLAVHVDERWVHIRVEDVGHPIPQEMDEVIYQVGERLTWKDPIRTIDGSGLGLPMAKALVEAHGGTISHTSRRIGQPLEDGIPPHHVQFFIKLPHGWKKKRR